jgi:hypothetical protein
MLVIVIVIVVLRSLIGFALAAHRRGCSGAGRGRGSGSRMQLTLYYPLAQGPCNGRCKLD